MPEARPRPQNPDEELERQSVLERPRPDYEPLGVHLEDFYLYPQLAVGGQYTDNVFYTPNHNIGDGSILVTPSLDLRSDWSRHAVEFFATGDFRHYFTQTTEDTNNYLVGANGRYDISYETYLTGRLSYQQSHEDRGSPDAINGVEPTPFTVMHGDVKLYRRPYRLNFLVDMGIDRYEFSKVGVAGGGFFNEPLRNRTDNYVTARVGFQLKPEYEAFFRATESNRIYDSRFDISGFDRTSFGYEAVAGTAIKLGAVTNGEVYGGWAQRFYEDIRLGNVSAPVVGASLLWNVTRLTSIRLDVRRSIEETDLAGSSSDTLNFARLSVEQELMRNLLLTGSGSVSAIEYNQINRTDWVYAFGVGLKYLVNRNWDAQISYGFLDRQSNAPGQKYLRDVVEIKLTAKL